MGTSSVEFKKEKKLKEDRAYLRVKTKSGLVSLISTQKSKVTALLRFVQLKKLKEKKQQGLLNVRDKQMTVEPPMAILRPNVGSTKSGLNTGSFYPTEDCLPPGMLPCADDHSLHMDLNISISSPSSQHMYESDLPEKDGQIDPLLSPSCSSICSISSPSLESFDFDLKPQFEQSKDLFQCLDEQGRHCMNWRSLAVTGDDTNMGNTGLILNMEDVIQVDELDLNQGPTLAQLNNEDSLSPFDDIEYIGLGDLEGCDTSRETPAKMPLSSAAPINAPTSPSFYVAGNNVGSLNNMSEVSQMNRKCRSLKESNSLRSESSQSQELDTKPIVQQELAASTVSANSSCLQELLMKKEQLLVPPTARPPITALATIVSPPEKASLKTGIKRSISPDSDTNASIGSVDRKWEEIKHFIHDEEPDNVAMSPPVKKIKQEPIDIAYTPQDEINDVVREETLDSEADDGSGTENDKNSDESDAESETSQTSFLEEYVSGSKKERRYFWQYNTQSKGPKGKRLCKTVASVDPHVLNDFEDPVFDPEQNQMRYKHNGKARRGDGNDITPSPFKLYQLGNELEGLNNAINEMMPVSELPNPARSKTRKEKNKFASRACRLKKKAQHEANKLKLYGLEQEHRQLNHVLDEIKKNMKRKLGGMVSPEEESLSMKLDSLIRQHLTEMIAGNTADYVNTVLEKIIKGDRTGGLALND